MERVDIYSAVPDDIGWHPIHRMIELMSSYIDADVRSVDLHASLSRLTRTLAFLPRRRSSTDCAVVIASDPGQLLALAQPAHFRQQYRRIIGWVIDSFWDDRIPMSVRHRNFYDVIFVTDPQDVRSWTEAGVDHVECLPWGSDVLSVMNREQTTRTIDLQRVGRQPASWDNDEQTRTLAASHGLTYRGRTFQAHNKPTPGEAWIDLDHALWSAKAVLAFSVRDAPTKYTHPTKDYLTGRWTDALAHGCVVMGSRPRAEAAEIVLWDGSTLELDPVDLEKGLASASTLLSHWTPQVARDIQLQALQRLDWRHRFTKVFRALDVDSPQLRRDLEAIDAHLVDATQAPQEGPSA